MPQQIEVPTLEDATEGGQPPAVFEGAYAAEVDHVRFTRGYWKPTTTPLARIADETADHPCVRGADPTS